VSEQGLSTDAIASPQEWHTGTLIRNKARSLAYASSPRPETRARSIDFGAGHVRPEVDARRIKIRS
jgi:hypothetical protein